MLLWLTVIFYTVILPPHARGFWSLLSILIGLFKFCFVLPGPLCCSFGPRREDWVPVSRLHRRGGSRERRDHVHLRAFPGSAGQGHGGEHPHRWLVLLTLMWEWTSRSRVTSWGSELGRSRKSHDHISTFVANSDILCLRLCGGVHLWPKSHTHYCRRGKEWKTCR